ncbi:MAG TPA: FAD-dependent oxidoreductase [Planctomycetaceae bacterium]|nr:FAD-dependent oxidoreductase [Planctomycetaceae bacterium]HCD03219.1 FAD-dependent oxidoreductase [Planctomycetaceae bacterium]|tara:strand:+ start:695 stop:1945 length:1251 start_codon:yes stop_codon:yes gene_type:complete
MARPDVVIFGGGVAGLWLLDELVRRGHDAVLLEASRLGSGQSIAAQGIIHGGLKYSLAGSTTGSALGVKQMPGVWADCLAGRRDPDLGDVTVRSQTCLLWRGKSLGSRLGFLGARLGLEVTPRMIPPGERPDVLVDHSGSVAVIDEQVIDPASLLASLAARHPHRLFLYDPVHTDWRLAGPGQVVELRIRHPWDSLPGATLQIAPRSVVLAAGSGNAMLRERAGLATGAMQRRPLHMVMVRGEAGRLPELCGHQVDGAHTRMTITSSVDPAGRTVWQLGGQVAEDGVSMGRRELVAHAARELAEVLPGLDLAPLEATSFRVDRAEAATEGGRRPETQSLLIDGNTITAWPTKLALAPALAAQVAGVLDRMAPPAVPGVSVDLEAIDWPRPEVAQPPWETATDWLPVMAAAASRQAA